MVQCSEGIQVGITVVRLCVFADSDARDVSRAVDDGRVLEI